MMADKQYPLGMPDKLTTEDKYAACDIALELCKEKGISWSAAAKEIGYSYQALNSWLKLFPEFPDEPPKYKRKKRENKMDEPENPNAVRFQMTTENQARAWKLGDRVPKGFMEVGGELIDVR